MMTTARRTADRGGLETVGGALGGAASGRSGSRERAPGEHELVGRLRLRDHVPLDEVAPQPGQEPEAAVVLDALGDDAQPEGVGEFDRRPYEREVAAVPGLGEARDEAAIELELADGEAAQIRQRREPGAEVVHRDDEP